MAAKKTTATKSKTKKKAVKKAAKSASSKKTAAKSNTKKKAAKTSVKTKTKSAAPGKKKTNPSSKTKGADGKERMALIEQTAYFIAEKRGFKGGDPEHDWLLAEKQVDKMLKQKQT